MWSWCRREERCPLIRHSAGPPSHLVGGQCRLHKHAYWRSGGGSGDVRPEAAEKPQPEKERAKEIVQKREVFVVHSILPSDTMADSESRFKRTIRYGDKEESVDLLTLAMKRGAEYDKVCDALESLTS